jgi:hypothetical protein
MENYIEGKWGDALMFFKETLVLFKIKNMRSDH